MNRIGFVLKVKQHLIDEYKQQHQNVWPDMLSALSETGWHNYSLFMKAEGTLFGYFETPDSLEIAVSKMATYDVNTRWQELMSPFFEFPEGGHADEMLLELEEVFHLD